jgi:hypothetical protein
MHSQILGCRIQLVKRGNFINELMVQFFKNGYRDFFNFLKIYANSNVIGFFGSYLNANFPCMTMQFSALTNIAVDSMRCRKPGFNEYSKQTRLLEILILYQFFIIASLTRFVNIKLILVFSSREEYAFLLPDELILSG